MHLLNVQHCLLWPDHCTVIVPSSWQLVQAALPCLMAAAGDGESVLDLRGGTDATLAPPVGYMQHVLLPMVHSLFGLQVDIQVAPALYARDFQSSHSESMSCWLVGQVSRMLMQGCA